MNSFDYILILLAVIAHYPIGALFIRGDLFGRIFLGLLITAALTSLLMWIDASLIKPIYCLVLISALSKWLYFEQPWVNFRGFEIDLKLLSQYLFLLAIYLLLFQNFHYRNYSYNDHDTIYWGFVIEILKADYLEAIRLPTFYPFQAATTHSLFAGFLASCLAFVRDVNLYHVIEARYLIISLYFASFTLRLGQQESSVSTSLLAVFLALIFFQSEIGFNLFISSYLYLLIVMEISLFLCASKDRGAESLPFLTSMLGVSRGPIIYLAATFGLLQIKQSKKYLLSPLSIFGYLVILASVAYWVSLPKPFSAYCQDLTYQLVFPFSKWGLIQFGEYKYLLPTDWVHKWIYSNWSVFGEDKYDFDGDKFSEWRNGLLALTVYILSKYFLLAWIIIWRGGVLTKLSFSISCALGVSLLAFLILRNGNSIAHQTPVLLAAASLTFCLTAIFLAKNRTSRHYTIPIALVWLSFEGNLAPFQSTFISGIARNSLSYEALDTGVIDVSKMWHLEVTALSQSSRIYADEYSTKMLQKEFYGPEETRSTIVNGWAVLNTPDCDN